MLKRFLMSLYPRRCAYCGKVVSADLPMCSKCAPKLPRITGEVCRRCGRGRKECTCRGEVYYDRLAAPFYYEGLVRKGIHAFKFRNSPRNAEAYCDEMLAVVRERYGDVDFDFIAEVPMDKKSIKKRGYNQVSLLAKGLSEGLGIENKPDLILKLYETEKQHSLKWVFRKGNLTGVFDISHPEEVEGKTVLLCDDISTSGETLGECAKMLWIYGAKEICCITVALTKGFDKKKKQ